MVKHGHTKKRRAGRYGRTKLKNRSWVRWDPNPKVAKELKEKWNASLSPAANLQALGLVAKPNQQGQTKPVGAPDIIELFDIPDSDASSFRQKHPLDKDEEEYIQKCMAKHGDDYAAMFRDIRVNTLQHTEQKLRKLGARYLLLTPEQRRLKVPDNIKELLPEDQQALV
ncbi:hypothetical protein FisN_6Hh352 [Fistulifera solaris]|uniref:Nucleolar protein 16 n=1 Tax=Fistulifera solaris TaxID=1519565 RepID=A0A1Z5K786_FISSO|nr:hypothetical protein FisN_6Hh352 [Fistulifera solaris]|eukprot:GAX22104.1 hypothetical protein FisN_6Hh352 [Fistulifera solaris]